MDNIEMKPVIDSMAEGMAQAAKENAAPLEMMIRFAFLQQAMLKQNSGEA